MSEAVAGVFMDLLTTFGYADHDKLLHKMKKSPSDKGKQQHYQLGKWFRERYQNFLPRKYSRYDIKVRSSDRDRALMSAQVHLAGLYSPVDNQIWNPQLMWQPIPIHTVPKEYEALLREEKACPKQRRLKEELLMTEEFLRYQQELVPLYKYVSHHTGVSINSIEGLDMLADTLFVEEANGFHLPEWTKAVYPDVLARWVRVSRRIHSYTPELGRLTSGPLIHEILDNFQKVTKGEKYIKYKIYSGHDRNLTNLMIVLGVYNDIIPPYASSLIFELRQHNLNSYVNIWYKNDTIPLKVTVPGCDFNCPLEDFVNLLKHVAIDLDEFEEECYEL